MHKKYSSFEELIKDFAEREGTAILYARDDCTVSEITYRKLADMIISESYHVKAACSSVEVIRYNQDVDSIVDIFAHVISGCDVILADPRMPEEFTYKALVEATAAKEARESMRDSRGRVVGAKGEGELLFFTSGTTSRSKIVRLTSASLCESAWSGQSMLQCGKGDVILSILSVAHAFGFVCSMLWGLSYGAAIALGRDIRRFTGDALFFNPTIIPGVPSQIEGMLKADAFNRGLKTILIGGAPCPGSLVERLREKRLKVYLGYGLTETSSGIAITQDLDEPEAMYPCPGADIHIEEDGEISVFTPCMMQGYIGREPMFKDGRFFTGDIGWLDDKGRLHIKGRKSEVLVMSDGDKLFCPEYEDDLERMTGLPDLGIILKNGDAVLVAGSCPKDPNISEEIRRKLTSEVGIYNRLIPHSREISGVIVTTDALPRTVTGKLKRSELKDIYAGGE